MVKEIDEDEGNPIKTERMKRKKKDRKKERENQNH